MYLDGSCDGGNYVSARGDLPCVLAELLHSFHLVQLLERSLAYLLLQQVKAGVLTHSFL